MNDMYTVYKFNQLQEEMKEKYNLKLRCRYNPKHPRESDFCVSGGQYGNYWSKIFYNMTNIIEWYNGYEFAKEMA